MYPHFDYNLLRHEVIALSRSQLEPIIHPTAQRELQVLPRRESSPLITNTQDLIYDPGLTEDMKMPSSESVLFSTPTINFPASTHITASRSEFDSEDRCKEALEDYLEKKRSLNLRNGIAVNEGKIRCF